MEMFVPVQVEVARDSTSTMDQGGWRCGVWCGVIGAASGSVYEPEE